MLANIYITLGQSQGGLLLENFRGIDSESSDKGRRQSLPISLPQFNACLQSTYKYIPSANLNLCQNIHSHLYEMHPK